MPLYLFVCACGASEEALAPVGTASRPCTCGGRAERWAIYGPRIGGRARPPVKERKINGFHAFKEASEEIAYQHDRAEQSAGTRITTTGIWDQARANVAKLRAAGVTDSLDYRPEYLR